MNTRENFTAESNETTGRSTGGLESDPPDAQLKSSLTADRGNNSTAMRLLIVTTFSVFLAEALIMILLANLPPMSTWKAVLLDASLIVLFAFPALYLWLYLPLIRDTSARVRAEFALQESEEKFKLIVETATDAFISMDDEGKVIIWNSEAERRFDWSRQEAIGIRLTELIIPPRHEAAHSAGIERCLRTGDMPRFGEALELTAIHRDGHEFPVEVKAWAVREKGKTVFNAFVRDITERKRCERGLVRAEKLESIGVLAGGIAHDFNNILTGILGNIELAKLERSPDEAAANLDLAAEATMRAAGLTQQLLTFAKGGDPVRKIADIEEVVRESATFALTGSNSKVEFSFEDAIYPAEIDKGQIGQVIHNLVVNASQAMLKGGTINICVRNMPTLVNESVGSCEGRFVQIEVRDDGVGIPPENLKSVFDPYFTTKQEIGNGLGLAVVHSIIQKHNGRIEVDSEVGVGSTFSIILPACTSDQALKLEAEKPTEAKAEDVVRYGTGRILVMDDESSIRDLAGKVLSQNGYAVAGAADGTDAIELYQQAMEKNDPFDVVILDLTVPGGMGGKDAIRRLSEIDPNVKAIVCSGYANDPVMAVPEKHGFAGVVTKPFKPATLLTAVHQVLSSVETTVG